MDLTNLEITNLRIQPNGVCKGRVVIDGLPCAFTCTLEFIQDKMMQDGLLNSIRTPEPTEEEMADWKRYDGLLDDPEFWNGAYQRVKVEREWFPYGWQDPFTGFYHYFQDSIPVKSTSQPEGPARSVPVRDETVLRA